MILSFVADDLALWLLNSGITLLVSAVVAICFIVLAILVSMVLLIRGTDAS